MNKIPENLGQLPEFLLSKYKNTPVFKQKDVSEKHLIYAEEYLQESRKIANLMQAYGIRKGSIVASYINPSYEWNFFDTAIMMLGAIHMPFYEDNIEFRHAIENIDISLLIVDFPVKTESHRIAIVRKQKLLSEAKKHNPAKTEILIHPDDDAYIIYSFTRQSELCPYLISHRQLIDLAINAGKILKIDPGYTYLSLLPVAKVYERSSQLAHMMSGWTIQYAMTTAFPSSIIHDSEAHATSLVPSLLTYPFRVPEKLRSKYNNRHSTIFQSADINDLRIFYGNKLKYLICGGAPLNATVESLYHQNNVPVFNGYGLTQSAGALSVSSFSFYKKGSAGKHLNNITTETDANNEILVSGSGISRYSYQDHEKVNILDKNSFFHSGDTGRIDSDGYIYIEGNLRKIFKMPNGLFINVDKHEEHLRKLLDTEVMLCRNEEGNLHLLTNTILSDIKKEALRKTRLIDFAAYHIHSLSENISIPSSRPFFQKYSGQEIILRS